ncbi:kinase-like domain-containing protein [Aspergillus avenaceus]|uniref:non-specific serine/threonine protein kinase n=1 Tax=Aspergillus avenaceus TaxID=36643 RepID=A0A5N6TZ60_ASPAV|nr:kinase-like domain-containing protein [Aspergillus avenaceus]
MSRGEQKYNWIDGAESLEKYRPGGYHPVMIGDILHGRYCIVDKLGFGGYSTIWLAQDSHLKQYVAIKVGIADALPHETKILRALSSPSVHPGRTSIPFPIDEFKLHGPNGTHPCYTMAPAQCNLREVSFSRLFPLEVARALSGSLILAIAYTHSQGYIHGDIHLRNVLVKLPSSIDQFSIEQLYQEYGEPETVTVTARDGKPLPPNVPAHAVIPLYLGKDAEEFSLSDARVILGDFGEAFSLDEVRRGEDCHTPLAMRPPEARFEPQAPLTYSADIWSLATTIWEILGMKAIFSSEFATADEVVSQQIDVLGSMPLSWWKCWEERSQFFDEYGRPKAGRYVWPRIEQAFEEGVQMYRRKSSRVCEFDGEETAAILELIKRMLAFRPEERPTAEEVLKSDWIVKWVLPDFNRSLELK